VYTLYRQTAEEVLVAKQTAWSVRLDVDSSDPVVFPPAVFVFQTETFEPDSRAWFTTVATPADLEEYPVDVPAEPQEVQQPYFRKTWVQLVSRNAEDLEELVQKVFQRLRLLAANIQALHRLSAPDVLFEAVGSIYTIIIGRTWDFDLLVRDSSQGPDSDLSGFEVFAQIRDYENNLILDLDPQIDGSWIRIRLTTEQTESLVSGFFRWDVVLLFNGQTDTVLGPEPIRIMEAPTEILS